MAFISRISRGSLDRVNNLSSARISDIKHLSSYNWIDSSTPTIVVPGFPAIWSPPNQERKLQKDSGLFYISQNAARLPETPLEPLFRALFVSHPSFDINSTDVIADGTIIEKLLSFASGNDVTEPFSISLEVVKNTLMFCTIDGKTLEFIEPHDYRGFSHSYKKAHTIEIIKDSTEHHRIISYSFGKLKYIIRHKTDACGGQQFAVFHTDRRYADISNLLGYINTASENSELPVSPESKLVVKNAGQVISRESVIEIRSRVRHHPISNDEIAPQLWVTQTPNLVKAYHRGGIFEKAEAENVTAFLNSWEARNRHNLQKLAFLIQKISTIVKGNKHGRVELKYDSATDSLVFHESREMKMLTKDLYVKWEEKQPSEGVTGSNDFDSDSDYLYE